MVPFVIILPPQNGFLWDLKGMESKTVGCWHLPIQRSDLGLIFTNKQTAKNLKMASYSRKRQQWLSPGFTELVLYLVWECFCLQRRGCGLVLLSWNSDSWDSCSKVKFLKLWSWDGSLFLPKWEQTISGKDEKTFPLKGFIGSLP